MTCPPKARSTSERLGYQRPRWQKPPVVARPVLAYFEPVGSSNRFAGASFFVLLASKHGSLYPTPAAVTGI
jgi:hypothetical protein